MQIEVVYSAHFVRNYKRLDKNLQDEVYEKIELFKNKKNHISLKVHSLKGRLKGMHSFSVNYSFRIIFEYEKKTKKVVILLDVGDHDIYDKF